MASPDDALAESVLIASLHEAQNEHRVTMQEIGATLRSDSDTLIRSILEPLLTRIESIANQLDATDSVLQRYKADLDWLTGVLVASAMPLP